MEKPYLKKLHSYSIAGIPSSSVLTTYFSNLIFMLSFQLHYSDWQFLLSMRFHFSLHANFSSGPRSFMCWLPCDSVVENISCFLVAEKLLFPLPYRIFRYYKTTEKKNLHFLLLSASRAPNISDSFCGKDKVISSTQHLVKFRGSRSFLFSGYWGLQYFPGYKAAGS
jgi:hypothetical protein